MEKDDRVKNIIDKAGGTTENADVTEINLAYKLIDGQKIIIPKKIEKNYTQNNTQDVENSGEKNIKNNKNNYIISENYFEEKNEKININNASQTELETLPGVGPSLASKIIEYRSKKGKIKKIEDLKNITGIGDQKFEKIKEKITV